jgi:hypothetical protein
MTEPKRPTTPRPLLKNTPEVEEGYYDLEEHERNQMNVAIRAHKDAVALWYRALTQYRRAMLGRWKFTGAEPGSVELTAMGLQMQLLGLGVSAAKSSLDDLLAGYYSQAFGGIRHMLETFVQCLYVSFNADESFRWYEQEGGIDEQVDPPSMKHMCQAIQAESEFKFTKVPGFMDKVYNSWQLMSKGAHPSGVGIRQTEGENETKHLFGATYRPELALPGFDIGLLALTMLLPQALRLAKPEVGPWSEELDRIDNDVAAWREANAAELREAEGAEFHKRSTSTPPRPVPSVSMKDVERCVKLLRLREDQMNQMRLTPPKAEATSEPNHAKTTDLNSATSSPTPSPDSEVASTSIPEKGGSRCRDGFVR